MSRLNTNLQPEPTTIAAWDRVLKARKATRPTSLDYIEILFPDFIELHGDRLFGDDAAIVGGLGTFNGRTVTIIAEQKGRNTKDNVKRNFGMPNPEGYRKALRLMKQAEKFNRPIICFVDTPGAYPGVGAEERGQGEAIARNLMEMASLKVPILSVIIAEGGSGGALALAVSNEVWMLENSIYSILSPEGFATILWKDGSRAKEASEVMKITAWDLKNLGIIEKVIKEHAEGAEADIQGVTDELKENITDFLTKMSSLTSEQIVLKRHNKFKKMYY